LGVVYGDIGTSPIYALRECFLGPDRIPITAPNVLGILSLIFWALILVVLVWDAPGLLFLSRTVASSCACRD